MNYVYRKGKTWLIITPKILAADNVLFRSLDTKVYSKMLKSSIPFHNGLSIESLGDYFLMKKSEEVLLGTIER